MCLEEETKKGVIDSSVSRGRKFSSFPDASDDIDVCNWWTQLIRRPGACPQGGSSYTQTSWILYYKHMGQDLHRKGCLLFQTSFLLLDHSKFAPPSKLEYLVEYIDLSVMHSTHLEFPFITSQAGTWYCGRGCIQRSHLPRTSHFEIT